MELKIPVSALYFLAVTLAKEVTLPKALLEDIASGASVEE
jgi:hypothetical protein